MRFAQRILTPTSAAFLSHTLVNAIATMMVKPELGKLNGSKRELHGGAAPSGGVVQPPLFHSPQPFVYFASNLVFQKQKVLTISRRETTNIALAYFLGSKLIIL